MIRINLLPKKKKIFCVGRELVIGIATLMLLIGGGIICYCRLNSKISGLEGRIAETRREIEISKVEVEKVKKLKEEKKEVEKKLGLINDLKSKQRGPAPLLNQISLAIPDEIWLSSVSTKQNQLSLEGMSLTANNVANFMKTLENINVLTEIELDKTVQKTVYDKKVQHFQITCNLTD